MGIPGVHPPPDLILTGRIASLDRPSGLGWVESLAIGGGRILAAGRASDVEDLARAGTRRWRLAADIVAMPALTDAHLHLVDASLGAEQPDLTGLDLDGVTAALRRRHDELIARGDDAGWLLGHGWAFDALGGRPQRELLDRAAPSRPVALWAHDHHTRWVSSAALREAALDDRGDPPAGRIERDPAGRPTGVLYEGAAGLVDRAIPSPDRATMARAIEAYARRLAALGVTGVHDPGGLAPHPLLDRGPDLFQGLEEAGGLPLRVIASVREEQLERAIGTGFHSGRPGSGESGRYRDGWLKVFSDGALGSRTASLIAPYETDVAAGPLPAGPLGLRLRGPEELSRLVGRAAGAGIASQVHAIGDAAVRAALDVLATIASPRGMRHRIEHAQLVEPRDVPRFGELGIAASVQPCHLISDAEPARRAWGERAAMAFPLAHLDRYGALLPLGTDAPVEPPDPWPGIAAAVTRRGPGWPADATFYAHQAISFERALRAACLDGPCSAGITDQGHLGVGARADLIILRAEPFDRPASTEELATVRPVATLLDGQVIHASPDFDP
jgi:predicted amidohydrolase YtcJ